MLTFPPGSLPLALAGLAAAAAPLVIHILNRQRYRVLDWAAMDFLLEASSRSRSLLQLRDILLLLLRTAAVALFGLAIARPFFASKGAGGAGGGPVHAILVIDNSLSMGREKLGGGQTLLDDARARALQFVERLPPGSRVSVIPLCGPAGTFSFDARRGVEDTKEAIASIAVVDRPGSAATAVDLAARAAQLAADLPDKRVVFVGDQQSVTWPADSGTLLAPGGSQQEGEALKFDGMQVVQVSPDSTDNTWVESLRLEDGVADLGSPAVFTAVLRHAAATPRPGVRVTLEVDGDEVAGTTVDLEPGQIREVSFAHEFHSLPAQGRPGFAAVSVSLPPDRVPGDDSRSLVAPVLASVPVVFVDQTGAAEENPRLNRFGETRHLRRLLAPLAAGEESRRNLVEVRHVRIDALDRETLADVRLVVVAGVQDPGAAVPLLREFVAQGGRLVLAAGADFDAAAWNEAGWQEGRGILPLPLGGTVGRLPEAAGNLEPFFLDWRSMKDDPLFRLPGTPEEELADLYESPVFFQAVGCEAAAATVAEIAAADVARAEEEAKKRSELAGEAARLAALEAAGRASQADRESLRRVRGELEALSPSWLAWAAGDEAEPPGKPRGPRVLAAFDNGVPFLVSRQLGRGEVVWVGSGLFSPWNTLPKTNAILLFDRLLRTLLAGTLPESTVSTADQFTIPLGSGDRRADVRLVRPGGREESLAVEALGGDAYGVTIRDMTSRGVYDVIASKADLADRDRRDLVLWERPLAANGDPRESEPAVLDADSFAEKTGGSDAFRWVAADAPISVDGARVGGLGSWWWLLLAALACLVAENVLLARAAAPAAEGGAA